MPEIAPVLTPTQSRQASPRRMNFHVLVWSMLLAVVAAAALYYAAYSRPESSIGVPREAPASSAPAPESAPAAPESTPAPAHP